MSKRHIEIKRSAKILRFILFISSFAVSPKLLYAQGNTYPTEERLFHIERSKNRNLVCYDINLVNGKLNQKEPLNIYWLNREKEPGKTNPLNTLQKTLAYGYKILSINDESCKVTLSAYSERSLTIKKHNGKYVCIIPIDDEPAILQSLYVKAHENNSLNVQYVELRGTALTSKKPLSERVKNKKK